MFEGAIILLLGIAVGILADRFYIDKKEPEDKKRKAFDEKYRDKKTGLYKPQKLGGDKVDNREE